MKLTKKEVLKVEQILDQWIKVLYFTDQEAYDLQKRIKEHLNK